MGCRSNLSIGVDGVKSKYVFHWKIWSEQLEKQLKKGRNEKFTFFSQALLTTIVEMRMRWVAWPNSVWGAGLRLIPSLEGLQNFYLSRLECYHKKRKEWNTHLLLTLSVGYYCWHEEKAYVRLNDISWGWAVVDPMVMGQRFTLQYSATVD